MFSKVLIKLINIVIRYFDRFGSELESGLHRIQHSALVNSGAVATFFLTAAPKGSRKKIGLFLVARPLRPYPPPPSSLVATQNFQHFFRASKNGIFS